MNELKLLRSIRAEPRAFVSPRLFHNANILLTPLHELADACQNIAGDNIFVTFSPPASFSSRIEDNGDFYENLPSRPSLDEALYHQICACPGYAQLSARAPASFWSSLLGKDGYLNCSVGEAAAHAGLALKETEIFLENLKNYVEPPGLFASDLTDSLKIQLRRAGLDGSVAWQVITEGQDALVAGKIIKWGRERGICEEEIKHALSLLRKLDPAPGKNFTRSHFVAAEVEFLIVEGEIRPRIVTENLPVVELRFAEFGQSAAAAPAEKWMKGEWRAARRALKLFGLRCGTVARIARYIATVQKDKILDFTKPPKPLTYASASKALSLHTSTLHRCAHSIYCMINGRCYPLSIFFSRASASDKNLSIAELRERIAELRAQGCTNKAIGALLCIPERTVAYHSAKIKRAR